MDRRNVLLFVVVVILVVALVYVFLRVNRTVALRGQRVLIAKVNLTRGMRLKADQIRWKLYPRKEIKLNYYTQKEFPTQKVLGSIVVADIKAGQAITRDNTILRGQRVSYAAMLKPGMRAISMGLSTSAVGSQLIQPGDRVDVLFTHPETAGSSNDSGSAGGHHHGQANPQIQVVTSKSSESTTATQAGHSHGGGGGHSPGGRTGIKGSKLPSSEPSAGGGGSVNHYVSSLMIKNVLVLGVDPRLVAQRRSGFFVGSVTTGRREQWATLEVTPRQAQSVIVASKVGTLQLVPHSLYNGTKLPAKDGYTSSRSIGRFPAQKDNSVTIIRGSQSQNVSP